MQIVDARQKDRQTDGRTEGFLPIQRLDLLCILCNIFTGNLT